MSIGDNIKKFRKIKKLTQQELASVTKISLSAIIKYENNQRDPKTEMLVKIANALDVPIMELIADENNFVDNNLANRILSDMSDDSSAFYSQPSIIRKIDEEFEPHKAIEELLRTRALQKELDYKYMELISRDNFNEIYKFIIDMLRMKITEIKSRNK
ncbi:helix-turn-helix domain-containing protein [Clostridium beijerinckii]|uniref:Transcriptional repressor DicA n=1 Tax=Clostridium beijerinckii TaxID=1520 RepID=A0A1S8SA91_CLOBE|nr:helix-turn-helix domain-containing protein [Clostridium beijerinckii]MBE6089539.1 helix-turn-helix transcriptional regulator [Clostridium beijerinckii]NRY60876.1 transcriptional regulator with XRE-family HTH domain [Clostridium beijerinckii]OOM62319.1 transcriptional repressor DicA [Clostridium beijerinckii]